MLIEINDGLLIDHSLIKLVKKGTHRGGSEATLDICYADPEFPDTAERATIFGDAEVERVYKSISRAVSNE